MVLGPGVSRTQAEPAEGLPWISSNQAERKAPLPLWAQPVRAKGGSVPPEPPEKETLTVLLYVGTWNLQGATTTRTLPNAGDITVGADTSDI